MVPKRLTLACLLLVLAAFVLSAKENEFKIDDSLYRIYQRADKNYTDSIVLKIADTLYLEAVRLDDKKAQCLAKLFPLRYYISARDSVNIRLSAQEARNTARQNDYLQYYYFASSQEINAFLKSSSSTRMAQELIDRMNVEAEADDYPFGLYYCFMQAGNLYQLREQMDMAIKSYLKAADIVERLVPEQSPFNAYQNAASCCLREGSYQKAIKYFDKALSYYSSERSIIMTLDSKALACYMLGDIKGYRECNSEIDERIKVSGIRNPKRQWTEILNHHINGESDKSLARLKNMTVLLRHNVTEKIYSENGDYKEAWSEADSAFTSLKHRLAYIAEDELAQYSAALGNEKLETEKAMLEAEKAQQHSRYLLMLLLLMLLLFGITTYGVLALRHKNRDLKTERDKALHSEKMKSLFVQNMSHEIRTPLNSIVGFSQLLAGEYEIDAQEREEYGDIINENAEQLAILIDDLLDISDIESGKYKLDLKKQCCNTICRTAVHNVLNRVPAGVELEFTTEVEDDFSIVTDKVRVVQILGNFLTNACKYTEEGKIELHLSVKEKPGFVTFSVIDNGPGVPEEAAEKIFERFEKLGSYKQGSGLGLSICRMISDLLGAQVKLDTGHHGPGARFVLEHPLNANS